MKKIAVCFGMLIGITELAVLVGVVVFLVITAVGMTILFRFVYGKNVAAVIKY